MKVIIDIDTDDWEFKYPREQVEDAIRSILAAPLEFDNGDLMYSWADAVTVT